MNAHPRIHVTAILMIVLLALGAAGLAGAQGPNPMDQPVEFLVPEVLDVRPHDSGAWTQGFLVHDGLLYESTGEDSDSEITSLRETDPVTGDILRMAENPDIYGEGLALVGDRLVQLSWKDEVAIVYDLATFEQVGQFTYEGEGWGLCYDGEQLYMSDGNPLLQVRDPETFELKYSLAVTFQGWTISGIPANDQLIDLSALNELECVGDHVYANVWTTEYILKINKRNGIVEALIDARNLRDYKEEGETYTTQYLNGIAYLPESDTFLITGKKWPRMFEVRFVPREN